MENYIYELYKKGGIIKFEKAIEETLNQVKASVSMKPNQTIRRLCMLTALACMLILGMTCFAGCNQDGKDPVTTDAQNEPQSDETVLIASDSTEYLIIRKDRASDAVIKAAIRLRDEINAHTDAGTG